jgi:hypothetical protein
MSNGKRGVLWVAALIVALISAALQIVMVAGVWSQFDSRLSCDRMISWGEWLDCMHGQSHQHILAAEVSLATWAIAGIVGALARYLAPCISFILPAGMVIVLALLLIRYWPEWSRRRTAPTLSFSDVLNFTLMAGGVMLVLLGPSVSAWLLGFHKRGDRARPQLSTVFE